MHSIQDLFSLCEDVFGTCFRRRKPLSETNGKVCYRSCGEVSIGTTRRRSMDDFDGEEMMEQFRRGIISIQDSCWKLSSRNLGPTFYWTAIELRQRALYSFRAASESAKTVTVVTQPWNVPFHCAGVRTLGECHFLNNFQQAQSRQICP